MQEKHEQEMKLLKERMEAQSQAELKRIQQQHETALAQKQQLLDDLSNLQKQTRSELTNKEQELKQAQERHAKEAEAGRSRLLALLQQFNYSSSSPSSSFSSSPFLPVTKKNDLTELKLIARGGSKAVYRCLYAKSPACYYCFLDGESTLEESEKIKTEFEQEVAALTKPALLQHPNILKVLAVRCYFSLPFISLSPLISLFSSCFRPFPMSWVSLSSSVKALWPNLPFSLLCPSIRRLLMRSPLPRRSSSFTTTSSFTAI
jgi:hypothetical protein